MSGSIYDKYIGKQRNEPEEHNMKEHGFRSISQDGFRKKCARCRWLFKDSEPPKELPKKLVG